MQGHRRMEGLSRRHDQTDRHFNCNLHRNRTLPCRLLHPGLVLPVNPYEDENYERGYRDGHKDGRRDGKRGRRTYYYTPEPEDFVNTKTESAEEYERRKKESDWDNRFSNS